MIRTSANNQASRELAVTPSCSGENLGTGRRIKGGKAKLAQLNILYYLKEAWRNMGYKEELF